MICQSRISDACTCGWLAVKATEDQREFTNSKPAMLCSVSACRIKRSFIKMLTQSSFLSGRRRPAWSNSCWLLCLLLALSPVAFISEREFLAHLRKPGEGG